MKKKCKLFGKFDPMDGREPDAIIMFMNIERKDIETFKMITDNDLGEI